MKFGASQLRFEDLHYSLSDGYCVMLYAAKLMCRLICNLRADGYVATKLMCRFISNSP